jgi:hypothetical protein
MPVETIIARQTASSGMYALGESLNVIYWLTLLFLLWPIVSNRGGQTFKR